MGRPGRSVSVTGVARAHPENEQCEILENEWIVLRDGTRLAARIWLPRDTARQPVPAILEYLPYRKRDGTALRDDITYPYLARRGYAGVRVDIRGNGESDGLMQDEYTAQELTDGVEVIDWIAQQPWCTGAVGMMGISWGGFNALQIAALDPAPLKAIVTVCSTDDRYADDIHYMGGCLLNDNLTWSQQMLGYSSRPPDPLLVGEAWRDTWLQRLQNLPLLAAHWLQHQRRDAFWKHASVCEDFTGIRAAVLAVGGWADAYSNAIPRLLRGLTAPCRGIIGPWEHHYPHIAEIEPRIDFLDACVHWWDRWLKGLDNGAMDAPALRAFMLDGPASSAKYAPRRGHWIGVQWPDEAGSLQTWYLNGDGLAAQPGTRGECDIASPQTTGAGSGNFCPGMRLDDELPRDQREDDETSLCFDSAPLSGELRMLGAPVLELRLRCDQPLALLAARLCDLAPDGRCALLTWAPLNLTHRDSHETIEPLQPGTWYDVRIQLNDTAYAVAAGHRLRLALSTSYWPMLWPSPHAATVTLETGTGRLRVPVHEHVTGTPPVQFSAVPHTEPPPRETLHPPRNSQSVSQRDDGATVYETHDDFGTTRNPAHGLEQGASVRQRFSIKPDEPLSAEAWAGWTHRLERPGWKIRTETWTRMTATADRFCLEAGIEAFHDDERVFEKQWREQVRRDGV